MAVLALLPTLKDGVSREIPDDSPIIVGAMILGLVCAFATILWFASRPQIALLYHYVRSIEFPFISRFVPHAREFTFNTFPGLKAGDFQEGR